MDKHPNSRIISTVHSFKAFARVELFLFFQSGKFTWNFLYAMNYFPVLSLETHCRLSVFKTQSWSISISQYSWWADLKENVGEATCPHKQMSEVLKMVTMQGNDAKRSALVSCHSWRNEHFLSVHFITSCTS